MARRRVDVLTREDVRGMLRDFCLSLGGRVEEMPFPSEFACDVDPRRVMARFKKFEELVRSAKDSGINRIYFGEHDAYFFAYPEEGEAGFILTYDTEEIPEEAGEKFQEELVAEFYDHMEASGYTPEFGFIPRVEYGGDYVDVEALVTMEELEDLKGIAEAMLAFKGKLRKLMKEYGVRAKVYAEFL